MDGHHGYPQEDMGYAVDTDLMSNPGWLGPTEQFAFQEPHPPQDPYSRFPTAQPPYEHYDISQQSSYPPTSYSQPPYVSQYQHARPSDVFSSPYNLDNNAPSLQDSTGYTGHLNSFPFPQPGPEHVTISPQSLHMYNIGQTQPMSGISRSEFSQQPLNGIENRNPHYHFSQISAPQEPSPRFFVDPQNVALQQSTANSPRYSNEPVPKQNVKKDDPPSNGVHLERQTALRVTRPELLAPSSPSRCPFPYAPYLVWDNEPVQVTPGLKNTLPKYHPRRSRSGKPVVPGFDISSTSATPARVSIKKVRLQKQIPVVVSKWKGTSQAPKQQSGTTIKPQVEDGSLSTPIKFESPPSDSSSEEEEESSSDEESEYEEEEKMIMHISEVRGNTRPSDVALAAGWDAIGIIWKDPGSSPSADVVGQAVREFAEFVSDLRQQLKTNATETKAAESQPDDLKRLKNARKVQLDALYETIDAANRLGYLGIVENLGGHEKLVNGLTATLIECIKTEDYLGKLPKAVFSLLAKFQTMTDDLLKRVKFDSIQKRWNKKGDEQIKKDIAAILSNTKDAKKRADDAKKGALDAENHKKVLAQVEQAKARNTETVKAASNPNSMKRPLEGDGSNGKLNKKIASDVSSIPALSKSVPLKKATNLLANNLLGSASKPTSKIVVKKREPSPPQESRLGAILASIDKPPEPPKAPAAPAGPPETPEEKKRRERKESRRHLRVKFKEGPELEQIRLFKHEQAEDEGRQDDMLRDAHDYRSEGMMHRQRVLETMDGNADIMDEDEHSSGDIGDRPYPELIEVDFSGMNKETRERTYVTRGGNKSFTTPEQLVQDKREGLELMVVYTDPKDIPPSPKEPPYADIGELQKEQELGQPREPWLVQRLQEIQQYGLFYATQVFIRRFEDRKFQDIRDNRSRGFTQPFSTSTSDVSSILSTINQQSLSYTQTPYLSSQHPPVNAAPTPTTTMDASAWENLIRTVNSLKGKPYPPVEPPEWMTERGKAEWWEGFNRDKAAKEKKGVDERMVQIPAARSQPSPILPAPFHSQIPPRQIQDYLAPLPQPNLSSVTPQAPDITHQVQSILAGLTNGQNGGNKPSQQYDYNGWSNGTGTNSVQSQQPRWDGSWAGENTRSAHSQDNSGNSNKLRGYEMKQWDGNHNNDGVKEYKGKKKPCKFWREGKCAKGAKCTFLHD